MMGNKKLKGWVAGYLGIPDSTFELIDMYQIASNVGVGRFRREPNSLILVAFNDSSGHIISVSTEYINRCGLDEDTLTKLFCLKMEAQLGLNKKVG